MKLSIRVFVLVVLILAILAFFFTKYFHHPAKITGQAVLSWKASDDNTAKGYRVYYGTSSRNGLCPPGGYAKNLDIGNNTKYTIGNLEDGKTYYFSVTSYNNSQNESCFSEEMRKTIHISFWQKLKALFGRK